MRDAVRFFRVVPPVPLLMLTTFAVVAIASVVSVSFDPESALGTLKAVIVLQLFAVSSGFMGAARRGHYDLLLTRGHRREVIAAAHWIMSAVPGLASWLVVALAELIVSKEHSVGFASGTVAAIATVSAIGWAVTTPLPRFAGAIGWIVIVIMSAALAPFSSVPPPVANVVYPLGLVGVSLRAQPLDAAPALFAAVGTIAAALAWIVRADVPLESAQ